MGKVPSPAHSQSPPPLDLQRMSPRHNQGQRPLEGEVGGGGRAVAALLTKSTLGNKSLLFTAFSCSWSHFVASAFL